MFDPIFRKLEERDGFPMLTGWLAAFSRQNVAFSYIPVQFCIAGLVLADVVIFRLTARLRWRDALYSTWFYAVIVCAFIAVPVAVWAMIRPAFMMGR